jgi:outer membrane protein assembly factor BamE (lipoprotein component of BamABCDE complex)
MRLRFLAVAAALLIAACSKVTQDNFAKIQEGMSEEQVIALLGSPSEVALKTFDKPGAPQK